MLVWVQIYRKLNCPHVVQDEWRDLAGGRRYLVLSRWWNLN